MGTDCPSTCALDVDIIDERTIGRVHGAKDDPYTAGVICEKVARYAERIHHPERLLHPLRRAGRKGEGHWQQISWDEAFAEIVQRWLEIERDWGPEAIWPYSKHSASMTASALKSAFPQPTGSTTRTPRSALTAMPITS